MISESTIQPPYPADLEAKGWSLDLDYERIEQSDTWAIAAPEQRPWLLMLWLISWRQVPAASLPNNHKLIAARIGIPEKQLIKWSDVLLNGWELASDGRLYHKTLTEHVLRMANKRNKDRERVAQFRAKSHATNNQVEACNALPTHDQHVSSTPTPTPTPKEYISSESTIPTVSLDTLFNNQPTTLPNKVADCPHSEILELWAEKLPSAIQPADWNEKRQQALRSRWREKSNRQKLDWWAGFFEFIEKSDFLMGRTNTPGRKAFALSLDWLCKSENFLKVIEGRFHEQQQDTA